MTILRSKQHTIRTTTFRKRALNIWEEKRCWINKNESIPHGHFKSPILPPKVKSVFVPPSGDVEILSDEENKTRKRVQYDDDDDDDEWLPLAKRVQYDNNDDE